MFGHFTFCMKGLNRWLHDPVLPEWKSRTDFTLQLHGEINFHASKARQVSTWYLFTKTHRLPLFKNVHKMMKFYKGICLLFSHRWRHMRRKNTIELTFLTRLGGLKWLHGKISSRQYKKGIPSCRMKLFTCNCKIYIFWLIS